MHRPLSRSPVTATAPVFQSRQGLKTADAAESQRVWRRNKMVRWNVPAHFAGLANLSSPLPFPPLSQPLPRSVTTAAAGSPAGSPEDAWPLMMSPPTTYCVENWASWAGHAVALGQELRCNWTLRHLSRLKLLPAQKQPRQTSASFRKRWKQTSLSP